MKKCIFVLVTLGSFAFANEIPPSYESQYGNESLFGFSSREVDNDLTFGTAEGTLPTAPALAPSLVDGNMTIRETNITVRWGLSKYILKQTIQIRDTNTSNEHPLVSRVDIDASGLSYL